MKGKRTATLRKVRYRRDYILQQMAGANKKHTEKLELQLAKLDRQMDELLEEQLETTPKIRDRKLVRSMTPETRDLIKLVLESRSFFDEKEDFPEEEDMRLDPVIEAKFSAKTWQGEPTPVNPNAVRDGENENILMSMRDTNLSNVPPLTPPPPDVFDPRLVHPSLSNVPPLTPPPPDAFDPRSNKVLLGEDGRQTTSTPKGGSKKSPPSPYLGVKFGDGQNTPTPKDGQITPTPKPSTPSQSSANLSRTVSEFSIRAASALHRHSDPDLDVFSNIRSDDSFDMFKSDGSDGDLLQTRDDLPSINSRPSLRLKPRETLKTKDVLPRIKSQVTLRLKSRPSLRFANHEPGVGLLHEPAMDIQHLAMIDDDEDDSEDPVILNGDMLTMLDEEDDSEETAPAIPEQDLAMPGAPSDETERADSDVTGKHGSDAPGSGYSDANQWFMQDVMVHLDGLECNGGIVTKVDGDMLTVLFLGGETRTFSQKDLACRVAKANAMRAPDEEDLQFIIAAAMGGGNADARSSWKPRASDSESPQTARTSYSDSPQTARTSYSDASPYSPRTSYSYASPRNSYSYFSPKSPVPRRVRSDSSARNLDLKTDYAVETKDSLRRFHDMLAKTPMPTSYADLCSGLTRSGVTNLAEFEHGVTSFGARIASSEELQHHLRPPARARAVAMTRLEAVAIHLFTLDNWDNPANSVNRVINMALFFQDWKTLGLCSPYLKCLMSGLRKLKRRPAIVWRGTIGDMRKHYVVGKKIFWWHFNPCTTSMQSLDKGTFLGRKGTRTIFNVRTDRAVDLKIFSLEHQEDALVLACCGLFEVESILQPETDVYTIDLVQTKAPDCKLMDVVFGGHLDCVKSEAEGQQKLRYARKKPACCAMATFMSVLWLLTICALGGLLLLLQYGPRDECQTPRVRGYVFDNARPRYSRSHDFRDVDVRCARGFYGNVTVTPCSRSWLLVSLLQGPQEYSVSGCAESLCEPLGPLPKGMVAHATEGGTNADNVPCAAGVRLSASTNPYCNATCDSGYRQVRIREGHQGFVCPLTGGRATSNLRCVRQNFCAPLALGDGVAASGSPESSVPPCFAGLELGVGQSCFVRCNENTHERATAVRTCTHEGSAPTSRLQCTRKGHCAALKLTGGLVGAIGAAAPACAEGAVLRADTACAVKCDASGAGTGVRYRPQRGELRCPAPGATATTNVICVKQGFCRVPRFPLGVVPPGFSRDCAVGQRLDGRRQEVCDIACDTARGYWPGVGNYHCDEKGASAETTLRCRPITCARPDTRGYMFRDDWEKSLSVPSFDVSVKCAPGFAGNPKALACTTAPAVTRVRAAGSCGAKRVRRQAHAAAHPGVFHSVRQVGGEWDYRHCAALLRQEPNCSQEWFEIDARGYCLCVPVDNNCSSLLQRDGGGASGDKLVLGMPGRYRSSSANYRVSGCEAVTCDGQSVKAGGNDAVVGRGHSAIPDDRVSTAFKAPKQPYLSTLVYPCAHGFYPGNVTYTCTQPGTFNTTDTCQPVLCTQPKADGYDLSGANKDHRSLQVPTFAVSGVRCAPGYNISRPPAATPCHGRHGGAYRVRGCTAVPCPKHSTGVSVGAGCRCDSGSGGVVLPLSVAPFYASTCPRQ